MKKRLVVNILFTFIFLMWMPRNLCLATMTESNTSFSHHRLIVKSDSHFDFTALGIELVEAITPEINILQFQDQDEMEWYYDFLQNFEAIDFIERDLLLSVNETPSINGYLVQTNQSIHTEFWGLQHLGVYDYSNYLSQKDNLSQITVAVIDTGIDSYHPLFNGKILEGGYDFINNDHDPNDDSYNGHGTHVAGIIAEGTKNLANVKILPLKVLNSNGKGFISDLIGSIKYAIEKKVDIINLSVGLSDYMQSNILDSTILEAINSGITVVIASGNSNIDTRYTSPARLNEAIIVSSVNNQLVKTSTSNFGDSIDVAAPGEGIYSALPGSRYGYLSGTSMAAPHITTVVAMLKLNDPQLKPFEIEHLIKEISIDLGVVGKDSYYGYGIPNLSLLLREEQAETEQPEMEQVEEEQPEMEQVEEEQPEMEQVEKEQPEMEQVEEEQPEMEQVEEEQPEMERVEEEQPEMERVEEEQPEMERVEEEQPEMERVEEEQPEMEQVEEEQPEMEQVEEEQPEMEQVEEEQPEMERVEEEQPEMERVEEEQPEMEQVEEEQPEMEQVEEEQPEMIKQLGNSHPVTGISITPILTGCVLLICIVLLNYVNKWNNNRKS